ncbi:hypothetical protein [Microbacterium enclense]|uniref:hypothetical protein n=1 Tax=Microbacterium enclense TaxID=993073 RepID=UPI003D73511C
MFETKKELAPLGGAFSSTGLAQMSAGIQRQTSREVERVQGQAIVAEVKEQGRAFLTNSVLQNVGALTALEQHLIQVAPLGEARYKHIVDSYAMGAAQAISRC